MRTSRESDAKTYDYVYSGDKLVQMTVTDTAANTEQLLEFTYDAAGQPLTMTLDGTVYYYVLNIQGDVMGMVDGNGNLMAAYSYTSYGEAYSIDNVSSINTILVGINPLTYRGYVLDMGTNLYYLQSRYYDPALGRFLNADSIVSPHQGILGFQVFAYCGNNPSIYADPNGMCRKSNYAPWLSVTYEYVDCGLCGCPTSASYFPITASVGVSGSIVIGPITLSGQVSVVTDSYGDSEIQVSYAAPVSSSAIANTPSVAEMLDFAFDCLRGIDASLMANMSFFNTPRAENLHGSGYQIGATYGGPYGAAVDINIIPDPKSGITYKGLTVSGGLGSTDVHGTMSNTIPIATIDFNLFDFATKVYNGMWGIY